ncbi:11863_t:CDS:2, partial [Acaulospora colombiana]
SRLIKVKYLTNGGESGGDPMFESLKNTIKSLATVDATEEQIQKTLKEIAKLFGNTDATISSFELLKSGLLDGLLEFTTATDRTGYATPSSQTPLAVLVKRLQESLTRMESFDVVTTSPGSVDDAKRSSMSLISRTLRLKLTAEEPADVPKSCQNLMVSIHAIAPFSALDDYLKPRIAGILPFRSDMSQGLLQALTGNAIHPSVLTQSMLARLTGRPASVPNESTTSGNDTLGGLLESLRGTISQSATPSSSAPPSATSTLPIPIPSRRNTDDSSSAMPPPSLPETPTSDERTITRRRSLRLRGQPPSNIDESQSNNEPIASTSAPASTRTFASSGRSNLTSSLLRQLLVDSSNDEGAERTPGNEEEDGATERAFNLAFDSADGNLTASTPRGTRIATPMNSSTPNIEVPIALAARSGNKTPGTPQSKLSYAGAALSAIDKATDFYLEFRINDEVIPMDMTVYGACHRLETRRVTEEGPNPHAVWNNSYTITYRKVQGKRPSSESNKDDMPMETDVVAGLAAEDPSSKILRLLRVLHRLNTDGIEHAGSHLKIVTIPDSAFINNKLTAKLARQLEEIMILASTSFGYARLLNRVISQYPRDVPNNNRREGLEQYGRLQRKKIEVPRDSPMQVALKVFDLFGASSSVLDIHFQGEVGTGLGPTLEFFASVSKEFAWKDLKLWRDADSTLPGKYVHHPFGLFPSPMLNEVVDGPTATERD